MHLIAFASVWSVRNISHAHFAHPMCSRHKPKAGKVKSSSHDRKHHARRRHGQKDGRHYHGNARNQGKRGHSRSSKGKRRRRKDDSDSTLTTSDSSSSDEMSSSCSLSTLSTSDSYTDSDSSDTPSLSPHHKMHSHRKRSPPCFSKNRDK